MSVKVNKLDGLKRELVIEIPADDVEQSFQKKLVKVGKHAKIDGFRPGKVPLKVIEQRYGESVLHEVVGELMDVCYRKALEETKLNVASAPKVNEKAEINRHEPVVFKAEVEVFPEIKLKALTKQKVERLTAELQESDIDDMLKQLQGQHKHWKEADRVAESGDQVTLDFEGFFDGEAFEGGAAKDFKLELGSSSMIPGFEEGIAGMKVGEEKMIDATFPEDYHSKEHAGKAAQFKITLHKVEAPELHDLDDHFAEHMGIKEGGLAKLKEDIRSGMTRELEQALIAVNKTAAFDKLLDLNDVDVPQAAIDIEVKSLQQVTRQRMAQQFGDKVDLKDFPIPAEPYVEEATKRVKLGLLLAELIKTAELKVDDEKVKAKIESVAASYPNSDEVVKAYYANQNLLSEVQSAVLEEMALEKLLEDATVKEKQVTYKEALEAANPEKKEG